MVSLAEGKVRGTALPGQVLDQYLLCRSLPRILLDMCRTGRAVGPGRWGEAPPVSFPWQLPYLLSLCPYRGQSSSLMLSCW